MGVKKWVNYNFTTFYNIFHVFLLKSWFTVMNLLIFLLPNCFFDSRSWIYSFFYSQTVFFHFYSFFYSQNIKKQFESKKISKFMTANQRFIKTTCFLLKNNIFQFRCKHVSKFMTANQRFIVFFVKKHIFTIFLSFYKVKVQKPHIYNF